MSEPRLDEVRRSARVPGTGARATAGSRPLSPRQAEILAIVRRHMLSNGSPPTLRDVMAATGIRSPNGVACHFRAMLEKGVLRKAGTDTARCRVPAVAPGCCPCCGRELEGGGT